MIQNSSWWVSFNEAHTWQCIYGCNFIQNYNKRIVFQIEKSKKKMSFLDIFTISPLQRPREISQNVSGPYYVRRGAGYQIHICAKLYYLGRAKVFSSVATDFGSWTKDENVILDENNCICNFDISDICLECESMCWGSWVGTWARVVDLGRAQGHHLCLTGSVF